MQHFCFLVFNLIIYSFHLLAEKWDHEDGDEEKKEKDKLFLTWYKIGHENW